MTAPIEINAGTSVTECRDHQIKRDGAGASSVSDFGLIFLREWMPASIDKHATNLVF